jgi:UDP-N-acetylmuramyl pentapeptide synthase
MPKTWKQIARELNYDKYITPYDTKFAIEAGAYYMKKLRKAWNWKRPQIDKHKLALASYNAGIGNLLKAQDLRFNMEKGNYDISGLNFKFKYNGSIVPVIMDNVITKTAVYAALSAASVGLYFGLNLIDIAASLKNFSLPKGRMSVLSGINHSFIIDDSYNSSPESCRLAIEIFSLAKVEEPGSKYAILGDMLEIGNYCESAHREMGSLIAKTDTNYLLLIGDKAKYIGEEANRKGFPKKNTLFFENKEVLINYLKQNLKEGDILLFKASRGIALETVIKEILSDPDKSKELLI